VLLGVDDVSVVRPSSPPPAAALPSPLYPGFTITCDKGGDAAGGKGGGAGKGGKGGGKGGGFGGPVHETPMQTTKAALQANCARRAGKVSIQFLRLKFPPGHEDGPTGNRHTRPAATRNNLSRRIPPGEKKTPFPGSAGSDALVVVLRPFLLLLLLLPLLLLLLLFLPLFLP
jgi:hypothetical protein